MRNIEELFVRLGIGVAPPSLLVLVVEDDLSTLMRLTQSLRERGHDVHAFVGVEQIVSCGAVGQTVSGERVPIELGRYQAAFLDHFFASKDSNGALLTLALRNCASAKILGMSSDSGANSRMIALGADFAIRKRNLITLMG